MFTQFNRNCEENYNFQGCLMKIITYINANDMFIEFQDEYKAIIHGAYREFKNGKIKNPYYPAVYNIGMIGQKYATRINNKEIKEYKIWHSMLQRCYDKKTKNQHQYYQDVYCCDEWLLFENFYEWLHSQPNFDKWINGSRQAIDKDIIVKHNKEYRPDLCSLVPVNVNSLFTKHDKARGEYPIGVYYVKRNNTYKAQCNNPFQNNKRVWLGEYSTPISAFKQYKIYKERVIKEVAKDEYSKGNITEQCFNAMMNYQVEITD